MPIKVLVMEATPSAQAMLTAIVNQDPDFTVVSGPADVAPTHDTVLQLRPDVLLLSADGQHLLLERDTGAPTVAQDERSSVVWGMAGDAVNAGAAGQILPLEQIAAALLALAAHWRDGVAARA